jgi:hypothetical protein
MMSPAPLVLHYYVDKINVMDMQNVIGKYNRKFAKGAG